MSGLVLSTVTYNPIFPMTLDGRYYYLPFGVWKICSRFTLKFFGAEAHDFVSSHIHQPYKTVMSIRGVELGGVNIFSARYTVLNTFLIPVHL